MKPWRRPHFLNLIDPAQVFAATRDPARVYLAGPIRDADWRGPRATILNAMSGDDGSLDVCNNQPTDTGWPEVELSPGLIFVGPYFVDCGKHCHGGYGPHGYGAVAERCLDGIRRADIVFAWLEAGSAGTIAELGFAAALRLPIVVAVHPSTCPFTFDAGAPMDVISGGGDENGSGGDEADPDPLAFVRSLAVAEFSAETAEQALAQFVASYAASRSTPRHGPRPSHGRWRWDRNH